MATPTPGLDPSTPPPAPARGRTRKPSAKVLEAQQSLQTRTTGPRAVQTRSDTTASQLAQSDELPSAQQHLTHDKLPPFPTRRVSISPEQEGGSTGLGEVVKLITSLKEIITQQNNIIAN